MCDFDCKITKNPPNRAYLSAICADLYGVRRADVSLLLFIFVFIFEEFFAFVKGEVAGKE